MKIRTKFFLVFIIIASFSIFISYYISSISIRRIVERQTEQTLSSSLYTNYSIMKNFVDSFPNTLSVETKARNIPYFINENDLYQANKINDEIYKSLDISYLLVFKNKQLIYSKSDYSNIDKNINILALENYRVYSFPTNKGILILTKVVDNTREEINFVAGKLINDNFLEKLYQDDVNVVIYRNQEVFLSTNKLFKERLPFDIDRSQNPDDFKPSATQYIYWGDRYYKMKYQPVINYTNNNLVIATMSSTLFEDQVFFDIRNKLILSLLFFTILLLIVSFYISKSIVNPFYQLASGISKKDKSSIKNLLKRKDEIGKLAHEFWDITEDLLNQQQQKEAINSLIAHDLKTPLVAITRTLETLRDKDNLGKNQRIFFINLMIKHCSQSLDLINNLLKVQKYELGKMNLFMGEESINNIIEECVAGLKPIAEDKEIVIITALEPLKNKIMIDRTEIMRVINNLLGNAIKYTESKGNIKIISKLVKDFLEIRITDNGKGISIYEQRKLFNFYKTSKDNSSLDQKESEDISTGLGLYLCKQIVEAHGGQIGVESYKNKGSTFYFSIPLR